MLGFISHPVLCSHRHHTTKRSRQPCLPPTHSSRHQKRNWLHSAKESTTLAVSSEEAEYITFGCCAKTCLLQKICQPPSKRIINQPIISPSPLWLPVNPGTLSISTAIFAGSDKTKSLTLSAPTPTMLLLMVWQSINHPCLFYFCSKVLN